MSLLKELSLIQDFKSASQLPKQLIQIDKLSDSEIKKIFSNLTPNEIIQIGPFTIYYLLKDNDIPLWNSMLEYIDIFYDQTCRGEISKSYKRKFKEANLMVLCVSHDEEIYKKHKIDVLNGFVLARYDIPKSEANIILVCFRDISETKMNEKPIRVKLGGGLLIHCLALNILRQLKIKNVYLEASDKELIKYYYSLGYKLGKSPCGKKDKITDLHEVDDIDTIIRNLPKDYADEKYEYAYRMKWCGFNEENMCFKAFQTFRDKISEVKEEMLKSPKIEKMESIYKEDIYIGPSNKYKVIKTIESIPKQLYAVDEKNKLYCIYIWSKKVEENIKEVLECIQKAIDFCDEISCFVEVFETDRQIAIVTTMRDGYITLEDYLTKRFEKEMMDGDKIAKNISQVLNHIYSLNMIPKISEKNIWVEPNTLEIYVPTIICKGDKKKNTKFVEEVYDTIINSNITLKKINDSIIKSKDTLIEILNKKDSSEIKEINKSVKKFGEKLNKTWFEMSNVNRDMFVSSKKRGMKKIIENIENITELLLTIHVSSLDWKSKWKSLIESYLK